MAISTNIRIDPELKKESQELFEDLGLTLSSAINIFLRQSVREQAIPFRIGENVPNAETRAALDELKEMKENPEKYKRYSSFKDALREILEDA